MATDLELALFAEELLEVRRLPEAGRWQLERDESVPLGLFAVMHPLSKPSDLYRARLRWTDFFGPPSLKFINMTTGVENDPTAWPLCFGFRPTSLDACLPWTAEGHAHHLEWKNSSAQSFPVVDAPMQYALLRVQSSLDNTYQGRGQR
ncbi:MAG: hypothetical protein JSR66_13175 [Proteobacteria bacterium]|nr:hypothetical protein [Pseudomonadota bacterium]